MVNLERCSQISLYSFFANILQDFICFTVFTHSVPYIIYIISLGFEIISKLLVKLSHSGIKNCKQNPEFPSGSFFWTMVRSSQAEVFLGKVVLKICSKFTGEHPCRSVISINEITLRHGCSPVNLLHIFRTPCPKNSSEWLLLHYQRLSRLQTRTRNQTEKRLQVVFVV